MSDLMLFHSDEFHGRHFNSKHMGRHGEGLKTVKQFRAGGFRTRPVTVPNIGNGTSFLSVPLKS